MLVIITVLILFLLFSFNVDTDYYRPKWILLTCIFSILFGIHVASVLSIPLGLLCAYLSIQTIYNSQVKHFTFGDAPVNPIAALGMSHSIIALWCIFGLMVLLPSKVSDIAIEYMPYLTIVCAIWSFVSPKQMCKRLNRKLPVFGMGANQSVTTTLISLMSAFSLMHESEIMYVSLFFAIAAIIRLKATIGAVGFVAAMLVFFFPNSLWAIPLVLLSAFIVNKKNPVFWKLSGREKIWKFSWVELVPFFKYPFGIGLGVYKYVIPYMQYTKGASLPEKEQYPIWAHSDIYQLFLETGVVGILICGAIVMQTTYMSLDNNAALAFIACYLVNSAGNFPNHLAPDSLLLTMFLKKIYS